MGLVRPNVDAIAGYVPGEQPQESGWIKLNTNENPYSASPCVVAAIEAAAHGRLNVYPDPLATQFRRTAAALFGVDPEWVLPANGSDENLSILLRTFVDPGELVAYPYPSYVLYETLADLQAATHERLPLNADWSWNHAAVAPIVERSKLVLVPNPNSPSGNRWSDAEIERLLPPRGLLVLDEAYGDFCDEPHRGEFLQRDAGPRTVITRTLSKSYSLAGIRFGFAIAHPDLIAAMRKVKDSYNCDTISLAAALAALEDQDWMRENVQRIRTTRERLAGELVELGYHVVPSQANFLWATHPDGQHQERYAALKSRRILVRYMKFDGPPGQEDAVVDGLRITIGTDDEVNRFLQHLREIG